MDASVYSQRLGPISVAQLQAALDRFDLGAFVRAAATSGGLFGQNLYLTSDQGEFVLRGKPHYPWQLPTEQFFARLLHERTVAPTPWPYLLDPADDIFGWPYALMPRLPGLLFADEAWQATLNQADRLSIAAAMGETLADLHTLTWPTAGRYNADTAQVDPEPDGFGGRVIAHIEELLTEALTYPTYTTRADVDWARALIATGRDALAVPYQPCVVMEDFHTGNVTIVRDLEGWSVGGVFDLMTLSFGDGEADLARQGRLYVYDDPALAQSFFAAYLARRPPRAGFRRRFAIYLLCDALILWTFCLRRDDIWWPEGMTLRAWVEDTLARLAAGGCLPAEG
ncbi:MAG: phosphotransferase family protein [Ktedonobacterales bacterium]|jgi:aminoglycoside phosphotransferase (APT) family kinase protein